VKDGNKRIRWILVEAAQHASRDDPRLRPFYLRILKRRGYQRSIVAVARKMLVAMIFGRHLVEALVRNNEQV
jgi:transposase